MINKPADQTKVDLDTHEVNSFRQESIPKIKAFLQNLYVGAGRDPLRMLGTLSKMLSREISVRPDYNANIPYVALEDGTLSLHVLHELSLDKIAGYKAIINEAIKPELIRFAQELDRAAQDQLLVAARRGLKDLTEARQTLNGTKFEPIDDRLLAVADTSEKNDVGFVISVIKDSTDRVRALLDGVFAK